MGRKQRRKADKKRQRVAEKAGPWGSLVSGLEKVPWSALLLAREGAIVASLSREYDNATEEYATRILRSVVLAVACDAHRRTWIDVRPDIKPDPKPEWFTWETKEVDGQTATRVDVAGLGVVVLGARASGWGELLRGLAHLIDSHGLKRNQSTQGVLSDLIPIVPMGAGGDA